MPTPFADIADYLDLLLDAVCVVGPDDRFAYVSRGAERVFGYSPEEMIGHSMFDFMHPDSIQETRAVASRVNRGGDVQQFENRYLHKDGSVVDLHWTAKWSEHDQMRVGVARDISIRKRLEREREALIERLGALALTDSLTQLPNRALFYDRVGLAQARGIRDGAGFGVLYMDIDKFKHINDEHGHSAGDELLKAVANRLSETLRPTDTVARLGGDEFVVLIDTSVTTLNVRDAVIHVAEKIRQAMTQPFAMPYGLDQVSMSIGMAFWPEHGETTDQLLHHADQAMYRAKHAGGNRSSE